MIKAVLFDCFEVLLLNASGHFFKRYGIDEEKRSAFMAVNEASDRGELTYEQRLQGLARVTGVDVNFIRDHLYEDLVRNVDLFDYISALKKSVKVTLLSNAGEGTLEQFMSETELKLFDDVVLSYEVGFVKPQPEIYRLAARRIGMGPHECLFVDDSKVNCEAADSVGMKAVQYSSVGDLKKQISDLIGVIST